MDGIHSAAPLNQFTWQPGAPADKPLPEPPSPEAFLVVEDGLDHMERMERVSLPSLPADEEVPAEPLEKPDVPPPALKRPVLMVHGYNSNERKFKPLREYLTGGDSPVNKYGGLIKAGSRNRIDPQGNVFEIRFSERWNPVEKNSKELKEAIELICSKTGAREVDLVTHSMGGLDARYCLMEKGEKIHNLVMVSPPNHGAYGADVELRIRQELGVPLFPPTSNPDVIKSLNELREVRVEEGMIINPFLARLNSEWPTQAKRANVTIITGVGTPTLDHDTGITRQGDDMVTEKSAHMDGADFLSVYGPMKDRHGKILSDPKIMLMVANALASAD
ncbi:MAG: alpha/beta hydrolase [Candidatus Eremiobacteraeota bacterium]|nr:alpha/beta hydrolase [Candidatus Eremiobacteraeota bacterium]